MVGFGGDAALLADQLLRRFRRDSVRDLEAGDIELEGYYSIGVLTIVATSLLVFRLPGDILIRGRPELLGVIAPLQNGAPSLGGPVMDEYSRWYTRFLEIRFRAILRTHLEPCLEGLEDSPDDFKFLLIYKFVAAVARSLSSQKDLALQDVVTELERKHIFKPASPLRYQLAFITIGWLTMLYDPDLEVQPDKLQISTKVRTSERLLRTQTITNFQQDLSRVQQPLNSLFRVFGRLIPQPEPFPETVSAANSYYPEHLILSYLCYSTLRNVAKVEIEWVDALNLHLDFDEANKVLKIFRFPSYCGMIYAGEGEPTFLSHLVESSRQNPQIGDFFREVILSYRLLFGQDRRSWKTFLSATRRPSQAAHSSTARNQNKDTDGGGGGSDIDPLLQRLCGSDWRSEDIYNLIHAGDASTHYCRSHFPFLGKRLLTLQNFSKGQHPHDWKVLWYDRRDLLRFYTFWAVIFLGAITIVVGFLQVALAGVQIVATYKTSNNNRQQPPPNSFFSPNN